MAWQTKKPASGMPARGVGKGDGWGGPPKGKGKGGAARAYAKNDPNLRRLNSDNPPDMSPEAVARRKIEAATKQAKIDMLTAHLAVLGLSAERQETQVSATIAALNRLDGLPVATQKNLNVETTFEELVKQIGSVTGTDGKK